MLTGTNHLLDFKNKGDCVQKPYFTKNVKSGRQVLESSQNPFFFKYSLTRINFLEKFNLYLRAHNATRLTMRVNQGRKP